MDENIKAKFSIDPGNFQFYCQHVLPLVYDNSLSYYEVLCKLGEYIRQLSKSQDDLIQFVQGIDDTSKEWPAYKESIEKILSQYQQDYQQDYKTLEDAWAAFQQTTGADYNQFIQDVQKEMQVMADTIDAIKSGAYIDLYLDSIKKYIDTNLQNFVTGIVKYVSFGISQDGHFVAYIPETWNFLQFSTITDPDSPLYKHLVISW